MKDNSFAESVRLYKSILSVSNDMPNPLIVSELSNCNIGNANYDILSAISHLTTTREILNKIQQETFEYIMNHLRSGDATDEDVELIHGLLREI